LGASHSGRRGARNSTKARLLVLTAPIWVPYALARCAVAGCDLAKEKSKADTAEWREKANSGDAQAQWVLGNRYFYGYGGVAIDDAEAAKWYRQSVEQRNGDAQIALGLMYEWGRGVEPDDVQAVMWYCVGITTKTTESNTDGAENATQIRDELEKRMTPDQIAEARRRAQEWKPTVRQPRAAFSTASILKCTRAGTDLDGGTDHVGGALLALGSLRHGRIVVRREGPWTT